MFADYYLPVILVVSVFLMVFLCYRFQKASIPLPNEACEWSKDHWVTNTSILVSRLNEVTSAKLPDDNPDLTLKDWLTDELGRSIRPCDKVNYGGQKFLITHYRNRRYNKVYIYPSSADLVETD